ncbi:MAG: restriction endonuclease subunit S [Melioribacteraceae bacterium]|nr:restriction endonuclease subunit S [Melioribacteraceae bacterium]
MSKVNQIPESWSNTRIDKCCDILDSRRIPLSSEVRSTKKGNIPYYGANGLLDFINDYIFDEDLILVAEDGGNFWDYQKRPIAYKISGKSWVNNHAHILKPKTNFKFNYLFYQLEHKNIVPFINGSTREKLNQSDLRSILIPIPENPNEQIAIASILSKIDEAIEATQNSIKTAEKLKKALMQNLLTGKLKPDGTWRTDDEFYFDEKFGKVPVGWEVARVKDYGFVQTGKTPPTAEPNVFSEIENELRYPFITPGDLGESKYVSTSERFVTEKGIRYSYKLPINSICVVCIGSTIGKIGITKTEACTNQQINALIANENNSGEFFFYMMEYRKPHFKEIAGINATPQINKSGFIKYKLLRPKEKSEQEEIVSQLNSFDEENITKQSKIRTLQRLKKSLMQNLLTGKVRLDVERIMNCEL